MSLSTFDGEPQILEHYDADGNLTGTTVVPGWTDEDRAWALGLALRDGDRCPRGHDLSESLDTENWRYEVGPPAVCNACEALSAAEKAHEKDPRHSSMLYSLTKRPRPKKRSKPNKSRG